jgi:hypothetical protein
MGCFGVKNVKKGSFWGQKRPKSVKKRQKGPKTAIFDHILFLASEKKGRFGRPPQNWWCFFMPDNRAPNCCPFFGGAFLCQISPTPTVAKKSGQEGGVTGTPFFGGAFLCQILGLPTVAKSDIFKTSQKRRFLTKIAVFIKNRRFFDENR